MSSTTDGALALEAVSVDDNGIAFRAGGVDRVVDVLFDGRRVWSFWTMRDTRGDHGKRRAAWPEALRRYLHGTTRLTLVDHVADARLHDAEVVLGGGGARIEVVDSGGRPLALDKSLKLSRVFESRNAEQVAPLLDSLEQVMDALRAVGIEPFVAYGTLLGAVRGGKLIGHDSDADIGYVSGHEAPVDAIRESFGLQRRLVDLGYPVRRYSGIAFRVDVTESDGTVRGLDVFGGILRAGHLYLMGEVGAPFEPEWIRPLTTVTLEGRTFPAPAQPQRLLEAMYGPSWRVPDPAYKFETSRATRRRLNGWFRGLRTGRDKKWDLGDTGHLAAGEVAPSTFAQEVRKAEPDAATVVDIGCGAGADAYWWASQGVDAWGLDFRPLHYRVLDRRARREQLPVHYAYLNLCELRSAMVVGARLARLPGPTVVTARHVLDSLEPSPAEYLLRVARMAAGPTGRLHLQLHAEKGRTQAVRWTSQLVGVDDVVALVGRCGGRVDDRHDDTTDDGSTICRMVVSWTG